jgi:acetyl esterase/lipase
MPTLQHALASRVFRLVRRNYSPDDVPAMRVKMAHDNRMAEQAPPRAVRRSHEMQVGNVHGFPVFTMWRSRGGTGRPGRTVFYLHGGAYTKPSHPLHWRFATRLADALGARTVFPIYPLAPEFTVADSFDEMVALFTEVAAESPEGVVLAGDSAGGGYALALALALRDAGGPQPERLVLLAPWVDLTGTAPGTREAAERDPVLSFAHLSIYAGFWAGSDDPGLLLDPRVSPGLGDLGGLPPTQMFCGTRDLLQPGCDALFEAAEAADWPLEYVVAPDLIHDYPLLPIPEAAEAFGQMLEFCARDGEGPRTT